MTMPNFLIIGAAKAGTTSLYEYLNQHPQIYMSPEKEPNFFALEGEILDFRGPNGPTKRSWITDIESYRNLFSGVTNELAIGEASVLYLYNPKAPERIRSYVPDVKLIAILRNPIDRAYSSFCFMSERTREPIQDFAEALQAEEARINDKWEHIWHYKHMGFYYQQLRRYFDRFDRSQINVYLYEDFNKDNLRVVQDIFQFLGVDAKFTPDISIRHHMSGIPKSRELQALFIKSPIQSFLRSYLPRGLLPFFLRLKMQTMTKPQLSAELRQRLIDLYREDILCLQNLLERDLSDWLK